MKSRFKVGERVVAFAGHGAGDRRGCASLLVLAALLGWAR
jgi:hypothetical protein